MRRDVLAAGARSAKFAGGIGETDFDRNIMSDEDRAKADAELAQITVEKAEAPKKIFRPYGSTILVRRVTVEELSSVIITEAIEKEQPAEGTVIAVGPGSGIAIGAHVVFGKYAGTEFKINGEILLIMDSSDVKGEIVDDAPVAILSGTFELPAGCIVGRT